MSRQSFSEGAFSWAFAEASYHDAEFGGLGSLQHNSPVGYIELLAFCLRFNLLHHVLHQLVLNYCLVFY